VAEGKIYNFLKSQREELLGEIEKWLKEIDITKPSSSLVGILWRRLKNLKSN
jgi:hypothetical protein